jgi:hypothetical protein
MGLMLFETGQTHRTTKIGNLKEKAKAVMNAAYEGTMKP